MVSVAQGDGFASILKDMGVDVIVEGGQTMNPAIEDLEKAINSINAKNVFVLPNNGNVILAAQQAAELSDKHVVVLPTKNVAMGIAAVVAFQPDLSPEDNAANMDEAAQRVRTGMITYAVRDSEFEDLHISDGKAGVNRDFRFAAIAECFFGNGVSAAVIGDIITVQLHFPHGISGERVCGEDHIAVDRPAVADPAGKGDACLAVLHGLAVYGNGSEEIEA